MIEFLADHAEKIGQGVLYLIGGLLMALGIQRGRRTGEPPPSLEVMGDVVVVKKIDALVAAIDMNTMANQQKGLAIQKNTAAMDEYVQALLEVRRTMQENMRVLERNTHQAKDVADAADKLDHAMTLLGDRVNQGR